MSGNNLLTKTSILCSLVALLSIPQYGIRSQEFTREISQFIGTNARQFLQPVADGFMANVNAGMSRVPADSSFRVAVQFVFVGAMMSDEQKTFTSAPFNETVEFQYNGVQFLGDLEVPSILLPTAVGMSKSVTFTGHLKRIRPKGLPYVPGPYDFISRDATVTMGGSGDISMIPLFAPQLTVGSLAGTELTIRYLPTISVGGVGHVGAFGIGIRHDVGRYFLSSIEITAQANFQSLHMQGTTSGAHFTLDASSVGLQLQADKVFGSGSFKVDPYILFGVESASSDIGYAFADPYLGNQSLTFESGPQTRFAIGAQVRMFLVSISGEYNAALVNGFGLSAGVVYEFK